MAAVRERDDAELDMDPAQVSHAWTPRSIPMRTGPIPDGLCGRAAFLLLHVDGRLSLADIAAYTQLTIEALMPHVIGLGLLGAITPQRSGTSNIEIRPRLQAARVTAAARLARISAPPSVPAPPRLPADLAPRPTTERPTTKAPPKPAAPRPKAPRPPVTESATRPKAVVKPRPPTAPAKLAVAPTLPAQPRTPKPPAKLAVTPTITPPEPAPSSIRLSEPKRPASAAPEPKRATLPPEPKRPAIRAPEPKRAAKLAPAPAIAPPEPAPTLRLEHVRSRLLQLLPQDDGPLPTLPGIANVPCFHYTAVLLRDGRVRDHRDGTVHSDHEAWRRAIVGDAEVQTLVDGSVLPSIAPAKRRTA